MALAWMHTPILAVEFAGRGNEKAAEVRTRLLTLWRRSDAELQPILAEIRTRLASPER
jgi:hypothetical protein